MKIRLVTFQPHLIYVTTGDDNDDDHDNGDYRKGDNELSFSECDEYTNSEDKDELLTALT